MTTAEKILRAKQDLDDVYEAGKAQGGGGDGFYDLFWDDFQQNGKRGNYSMAFAYAWGDEAFCPKYDIVPTVCGNMFNASQITSLKGKLDKLGKTLDLSNCTTFLQVFQNSYIKDLPILDGTKNTNLNYTFSGAKVETIEKLILSNKLTTVSTAFNNADKLTHVIFEGELAITGLNLHWSTLLDAESYHSLMNILSPNTTGMSVTLPPYATVKATYDAKYGEGAWDAIVASKPNWTISYL